MKSSPKIRTDSGSYSGKDSGFVDGKVKPDEHLAVTNVELGLTTTM